MSEFWLFLKLLPVFIRWTKEVKRRIKAGIHEQEVVESMEKAAEAFACEDAKETESRINDLWNVVRKPKDPQ